MHLDESNPLIHNEHLYKSMVKMTLRFFKNLLIKYDDEEKFET